MCVCDSVCKCAAVYVCECVHLPGQLPLEAANENDATKRKTRWSRDTHTDTHVSWKRRELQLVFIKMHEVPR